MTQLAGKFSLRRIMIVCLVVLVPATGFSIAFAPLSEQFKTNIHNALVNTTLAGAAVTAIDRAIAAFEHLEKVARKRW